jgi:hypothetical protein
MGQANAIDLPPAISNDGFDETQNEERRVTGNILLAWNPCCSLRDALTDDLSDLESSPVV